MSGMVGRHIGKYRVTRQVGRGGMGTVYAAVDETLHREVAIKILNAGLDDPTVARRFRAEAVAVARLNHSGIATIYELLEHDAQWLMVMEFVRGETLEQALANDRTLTVPHAAEVIDKLLAALFHAHGMGVVHRDLKPANIMLTPGGGVKVMDFGIARVSGAEQLTSAGFMMGTPAYMAPEQVTGGAIDARTDLYAVGIVFFQMVSGQMPFGGTTAVQLAQARINESPASLRDVRPDLPAWVSQVIDVALARDPDRRFPSAQAFREAIAQGMAGQPIVVDVQPPASLTLGQGTAGSLRVIHGGATTTPAAHDPSSPRPHLVPARPDVPRDDIRIDGDIDVPPVSRRSPVMIGGAAAVAALMLVVGAWWWRPGTPASTDPDALPVTEVSTEAAPPPTFTDPDQDERVPADSEPVLPAPATAAASVSGAVAGTRAAVSVEPASAAVTPPPASPAEAAAPASTLFRGVRALVIDGRRAVERPAVLAFADGVVTLFDDSATTALVELPYQQVTAAAYTRARHPRWYPTLAGPPIDVDMPGGLFRGDRHWLALQSRDRWLIVRMNDGDWQQITATVTARLGLAVDHLRQ